MLFCGVFFGEKLRYRGTAFRTFALGHWPALGGPFDFGILNLPLRSTFDTIGFDFHCNTPLFGFECTLLPSVFTFWAVSTRHPGIIIAEFSH